MCMFDGWREEEQEEEKRKGKERKGRKENRVDEDLERIGGKMEKEKVKGGLENI